MDTWFNSLKSKIEESLPVQDITSAGTIFEALTFQTPELKAEHDRIATEEQRKEAVKDSLASLLPWETRNEESEILVEECRELIMALSLHEKTFTSPFSLVSGFSLSGTDSGEKVNKIEVRENIEFEGEDEFPDLLRNFDLDAHVGLIQRLLEVDPNLVEMHSQLSRGGSAEILLWKNYFYHCADIRSKIGLSNNEIWDYSELDSKPTSSSNNTTVEKTSNSSPTKVISPVTSSNAILSETEEILKNEDKETEFEPTSIGSSVAKNVAPSSAISPSNNDNQRKGSDDFEIIESSDSLSVNENLMAGAETMSDDLDLDDLEAEIARELEN